MDKLKFNGEWAAFQVGSLGVCVWSGRWAS